MIEESDLRLAVADGAGAVARHYLKQASKASDRLASDARDDEALHDFRVAVRRLRSWIRAFDTELTEIRKRDERRLKRIAHATNPGRDAQVQLEWIDDVAKRGSESLKHAARWLHGVIDERRRGCEDDVAKLVAERWPRLEDKLQARLDASESSDDSATLAQAIVARLPKDAEELWEALDEIRTIADEAQAHEARIAAKRLRYLIEPAAPHVPSGETLRDCLKAIQDDLGRLHDLHVLTHEIVSLAVRAPDSLVPVAERLRKDLEATFAQVRDQWLGRPSLLDIELTTFADELLTLTR